MKNFSILLCLLFLFSFSCQSPEVTVPLQKKAMVINDKDSIKLKYLKEVEWPKAYKNQDTVLLDRILADDFKMIDAAGAWYTKQDELEWIKKNAFSHDSFFYEIKRLDILENGTALVCGTGHIYNEGKEGSYQSSNVLVKRNGEWKAILSHVSGVK